jgi:isoquinoline 1-oxidoreductase alpha subunit
MPTLGFELNGKLITAEVDAEMPLLWYLRDHAGLTGTKYGCGIAQCGACTVHVNGVATRACVTPLASLAGAKITTIEGLSELAGLAAQQAWQTLDVVQCGYCQSGQIMSATTLLANHPQPTDLEIDQAMRGNLCRCATYQRIRAAIHRAAEILQEA